MEKKSTQTTGQKGETTPSVTDIWRECESMLKYAMKQGKPLEKEPLAVLETPFSESTDEDKVSQLFISYNYLLDVVKPTSPRTITALEQAEGPSLFRIFGPLPIIRQFMVVALLALTGMIGISLSPHVNTDTIQLSMLQGSGPDQMLRLVFLVSCASVGAAFFALYKMNNLMARGTFDVSDSHVYWSQFVLGIVAGLLLSELFVAFIEPANGETTDSTAAGPLDSLAFLLKPVLAILGGFSANLLYRILNKLVSTVETLFKEEADDIVAQREFQAQLQAQERSAKLRSKTANQLLSLKQVMVKHQVPEEVVGQLDQALSGIIGSTTNGS